MYRWLTGLRDGTNGFDALPTAERQRLLAHSRVVLAEIDPHPFGVLVEYVPLRKIAALPMPVTWLLGAESMPWYRRLHARVVAVAPSIRTEYITGAGHLMPIEAPEAFVDAVHRAIRMVDEPSSAPHIKAELETARSTVAGGVKKPVPASRATEVA